jgi:hypothetical protein
MEKGGGISLCAMKVVREHRPVPQDVDAVVREA